MNRDHDRDPTDYGLSPVPDDPAPPPRLMYGRIDPAYNRPGDPEAAARWLPRLRAIIADARRRHDEGGAS